MNTQTIQPHNSKAATTWSAGGLNYDRISHFISAAIEHCVTRIAPRAGEDIIATDLIEAARKLASKAQFEIDFQIGDAEALSFEDNSFDAVVSTFGVMFVSKPEAAAAELARVCKKGGRIGLTTWFPEGNIFGIFKVMKPYQPTPATPPPPSPFAWGTKERVTELFGSAFDLKFETGTVFLREPSGQAVWELFLESYGPTKMLAASLDTERRDQFKSDFIAFHENFKSELGIAMPCEYLVTVGIRK